MSLHSRIKEARKNKGLTQAELGNIIGVAKTTIAGYEKQFEPSAAQVGAIADACDVSVDFLYQDEIKHKKFGATPYEMEHIIKKYRLLDQNWKEAVDNILNIGYQASSSAPQEEKPRGPDQDKIIYIFPGYSMPMSAGRGQPAGEEYHENYRLVKEPPRRASFIAPVSGDSMEPEFHNGDFVFVRAQYEVEIGQVGVFFMDGQQWIKERGDKELISYNPKYKPIPMQEGTICQGLVLGVCDESYFEQ